MVKCLDLFTKKLEKGKLDTPTGEKPRSFAARTIEEIKGRAQNYVDQGVSPQHAYESAHHDMMSETAKELDIKKARLATTALKFQGREEKILKGYREATTPREGVKQVKRSLWELLDPSKRFSKGEGNNLQTVLHTETKAANGILSNIFDVYKAESGKDPFKTNGEDLGNAILYARQERFSKGKRKIDGHLAPKPTDNHIAKMGRAIEEHQTQLFKTEQNFGNPIPELSNYIHGNQWNRRILLRAGGRNKLEKYMDTKVPQIKGLSTEGTQYFYSDQGQRLAKMAKAYSDNTDTKWNDFFGETKAGSKYQAKAFVFWLSDMQKLADMHLTFPDVIPYTEKGELTDKMIKVWYGAFRKLSSTARDTPVNADNKLFSNPNLKRRQIHFKDPQTTNESTERWGGLSTTEAIEKSIAGLGRRIGMLKWGGGAIHTGFNNLVESIKTKIGDNAVKSALNKSQRLFNILTGNILTQETVVSTITQGLLTAMNFAKLGLVTPSSLPDSATTTTALMYHGKRNVLDLVRNHVVASVSSYGAKVEKDYQKLFDLLGVGADFMRSELALSARAGETFSLSQAWSRLNYRFFQFNLLHHHDTQIWRQAVAVATRMHAMHSPQAFKELPEYMQREFGRFDIGSREWDFYRKFLDYDSQGRAYLDFSQFNPNDVTDKATKALSQYNPALKKKASRYYAFHDLYDRYTQMLDDLQRQSVVIPTAGTQYFLHGAVFGTEIPRGSPLSAVFSLISQFKNFPMQLTRTAMSGVWDGVKNYRDFAPAVNLVATQFMYNYLAWGAKSLLNFKSWPSFSQMKDNNQRYQSFLEEVLMPSLGFVDLVMGNDVRESSSFAGSFMGPTGQLVQTLGTDLIQMVHGHVSRNQLLKPLSSVTPTTLFMIGPILKQMLDALKTHQSQRTSLRYLHNQGQHYLFRSSQ